MTNDDAPEETRRGRARLAREEKTIAAMIRLYCLKKHRLGRKCCPACEELLRYSLARLDSCPFGEGKPTCDRCPVHCYRPGERERIKAVMRFAGPRMLTRYPYLAVRHLFDRRRRLSARG